MVEEKNKNNKPLLKGLREELIRFDRDNWSQIGFFILDIFLWALILGLTQKSVNYLLEDYFNLSNLFSTVYKAIVLIVAFILTRLLRILMVRIWRRFRGKE